MRYLSSSERGDLVVRLAAWPGVQGPERLILFQIAGSIRLTALAGRVLCDITLEELATSLGRSVSAVRTSLSRLRSVGVTRSDDGRSTIDLTRLAHMVGFEVEVRSEPGTVVLRGARGSQSSPAPHRETGGVTPQLSGALAPTSKSQKYISSSTLEMGEAPVSDAACGEPDSLSLPRIREIMDAMLQDDIIGHLNRKDELKAFFGTVLTMVGDDWTNDRLRAAAEHAIPLHFRQCDAGAGLTLRLAREGGKRFGAMLVLHAAHALMHGRQPNGLLVSMIKGSKTSPQFTEFCIGNAVKDATAEVSIAKYRAQYEARKAGEEQCTDVMRAVMRIVQTAPELDAEERAKAMQAARGYVKLDVTQHGDTRVVMGLPSANDAMLWTSVVDRLSSRISEADLPSVTVCKGGLPGAIRLSDLAL